MRLTVTSALCALIATALGAGCASQREASSSGAAAASPATGRPATAAPATLTAMPTLDAAMMDRARATPVLDGATGATLAWADVVARARAADAVIIGENHGHELGLALAAALFDEVLGAGAPGSASGAAAAARPALALEFLERDDQSRLDDYLTGLSDAPTFLRRTGRTAGNFPAGHAHMVESARRAGAPVIAANAPRASVRTARTQGFERLGSLSDEQRRLFRVPDELIGGRYRDDWNAVMRPMMAQTATAKGQAVRSGATTAGTTPATTTPPVGSPTGGDAAAMADESRVREQLDSFYRAQQMWDWTMAESVARALERGHAPVVLVVGRFHSDFRGGLVQALERLRPGARVLVLSTVNEDAPALRDADRARGDFVVYVGPSAPGEQ